MFSSIANQPDIASLELLGGGEAYRDKIAALLERGYLFRELEWEQINSLVGYMGLYRALPGTTIFREGDRGEYLCVLTEGRLEMRKEDRSGTEKIVATLTSGKTMGEMAMVDGEPRSATAVVSEEATLVVLTRENFTLLSHEKPALAIKILFIIARMLSQRLRQTSGTLVDYLEG